MAERVTIRSVILSTVPRSPLCDVLDVKPPYLSEIASGSHPGPKITARMLARILIPKYGRARAAEILLDSYEDRFDGEFAADPPEHTVLEQIGPRRADPANEAA